MSILPFPAYIGNANATYSLIIEDPCYFRQLLFRHINVNLFHKPKLDW